MNFGETYISKKKIIFSVIGLAVLIVGLVAGIYLVQVRQIFRGRAATVTTITPTPPPAGNFVNAFEIKDDQGRLITCNPSTNPPTCESSSREIRMKIVDSTLLLP